MWSAGPLARGLGWCGGRSGYFSNPQAQNLALVRLENLEAESLEIDCVTRCGYFARNVAHQTGNGGDGFVRLIAELDAEQFFDIADRHTASHDQAAVAFANDVGRGLPFVTAGFA